MPTGENHHRDMADTISRLFWDNFIKSEPALTMRDVIAIELDKVQDAERQRCGSVVMRVFREIGARPGGDIDSVCAKIQREILMPSNQSE